MLETNLVSRISLEEFETIQAKAVQPGPEKHEQRRSECSRREFLKLAGIASGTALLTIPMFQKRAEAVAPFLIFAAIGLFVLAREVWAPKEEMSGKIQLINRSNTEKRGAVALNLLQRASLDVAFQGMGNYLVPPRTVDTYGFSGPRADQAGPYYLQGSTEVDKAF